MSHPIHYAAPMHHAARLTRLALPVLLVLPLAACAQPEAGPGAIPEEASSGGGGFSLKRLWQKDTVPADVEYIRSPDGQWQRRSDAASADPELAAARRLFQAGDYDAARRKLWWLARKYKDLPVEEEILYLKAESLYQENYLPAAQDEFAGLLVKYPTSRYLPQAVQRTYDIAYYWLEDSRRRSQGQESEIPLHNRYVNLDDRTRPMLDAEGRALKAIETIQQYDPLGPLTDDAVMMAAAHRFVSGDFIQAAGHYERLSYDQPKSPHVDGALVLGSQAHLRSYDGPQYEGVALDDAERLIRLAQQRETVDPARRAKLDQDMRTIRQERAKRLHATGREYVRMWNDKAARYYFERCIKEYNDTEWARRSEQEIAQIVQRANQPPGFFGGIKDAIVGARRDRRAPPTAPAQRTATGVPVLNGVPGPPPGQPVGTPPYVQP